MEIMVGNELVIIGLIVLIAIVFILVIVWAIRHTSAGTKNAEIELEKQKLSILQKDIAAQAKVHPFTKLSVERIAELRAVEEANDTLELDIYAKQKMVEARLRKLENLVQQAKLDRMLLKIDLEEKKVK
jgi:hypothetical protein